MTGEEASFYLANMDRKYMEEGMSEALDMAIKALEQESKAEVLDKIRAEIIDKYMTATGEVNTVAKGCLQIIDKYKAESEDKG